MNVVVNFRVRAVIKAESVDEARSKFEEMELGDGIEFVELVDAHDEDTYEDLTGKF
jgi:hypothetical protein